MGVGKRSTSARNDSFTYVVVDYDAKRKEYTLKNPKTGRVKVISKADFDFYRSQEKAPQTKP
jgi:hypothetical protein